MDFVLFKEGQLLLKYTVNYGYQSSGGIEEKYIIVFSMENKEACPTLTEWTVQADFVNKLDIFKQFSDPLFPYCRDNYQWMQENKVESFTMLTGNAGIECV